MGCKILRNESNSNILRKQNGSGMAVVSPSARNAIFSIALKDRTSGEESLDGWKNAVLLSQAHEGVVALSHSTDLATDGVGFVLASSGHATSLLVNHRDVNLDGGVVASSDNPVGGGAFSGNVKIDVFTGFVLHLEIVCFNGFKKNLTLNKLK